MARKIRDLGRQLNPEELRLLQDTTQKNKGKNVPSKQEPKSKEDDKGMKALKELLRKGGGGPSGGGNSGGGNSGGPGGDG
jgi:uncharacterized membrane protein YgcG